MTGFCSSWAFAWAMLTLSHCVGSNISNSSFRLGETDRRLGDFDFLGSLRDIEAIAQAIAFRGGRIREDVDKSVRLVSDVYPHRRSVERVVRDFQVKGGVCRNRRRIKGNKDLLDQGVRIERARRRDTADGAAERDLSRCASAGAVGGGDRQDVGSGKKRKPYTGQVDGVLDAAGRGIGAKRDRLGSVGQFFRDRDRLRGRLGVCDRVLVCKRRCFCAQVLIRTADHGRRVVGNGFCRSGAVTGFKAVRVDCLHARRVSCAGRRNCVGEGLRRGDP